MSGANSWGTPNHVGSSPPTYSKGQRWWPWIPVLSAGLLAWLPAYQAYTDNRDPQMRKLAIALAAGAVVVGILVAIDSAIVEPGSVETSPVGVLGGLVAIPLCVIGVVTAFRVRPVVFGPPVVDPLQPAITDALAARQLRQSARDLAMRDPSLARELRIGRPDLPLTHPDGGLVDLNTVPGLVIAQEFGWSTDDIDKFLATRDHIGGFMSLAEVSALTGIEQRRIDEASERALLMPSTARPEH